MPPMPVIRKYTEFTIGDTIRPDDLRSACIDANYVNRDWTRGICTFGNASNEYVTFHRDDSGIYTCVAVARNSGGGIALQFAY